MKLIQKITAKQTYTVRHLVLRQGKPIETCRFEGDDLETTTHFGLLVDKNIVGIVSIFQNKSDIFVAENQYQIRGMAVLDDFQQKAVEFYQKLGYTTHRNSFIIDGIGSHYVMYKMLA